ncbi:hypothetical protein PMZ80_010002 [Knufia obscura]|uniref:DUF7918 domain-containing protein n=1 Tax=Knufia obscura TaxID=1635080 RepID=A0ABR0RB68_9EURO|nr:hypothetical protein PMZ80_010002 [Knufia obscura]
MRSEQEKDDLDPKELLSMAIFEQIESRIIVDKKHLLEYDYNEQNDNDLDSSPDDESTIIEKYVESRPGKNFEVELQLYPGFHFNRIFNALSCDVFVDGNRVGDRLLMQKDYSRRKKNPLKRSLSGIEAYRAGKEELQKFKFKHLESHSEAPIKKISSRRARHVGTIRIQVYKYKVTQSLPEATVADEPATIRTSEAKLSEKCLKGLATDMITSFDAPIEDEISPLWDGYESRQVHNICLTKNADIFAGGLQNIGILARPPLPPPLEERPRESLSRDELLELLRRQDTTIKASKQTIKQEGKEPTLKPVGSGKRARGVDEDEDAEPQAVRRLKLKVAQPKPIELSDSD